MAWVRVGGRRGRCATATRRACSWAAGKSHRRTGPGGESSLRDEVGDAAGDDEDLQRQRGRQAGGEELAKVSRTDKPARDPSGHEQQVDH